MSKNNNQKIQLDISCELKLKLEKEALSLGLSIDELIIEILNKSIDSKILKGH